MDLILWRHSEAEKGMPDLKRKLTKRGLKQAEAVAEWLIPRLAERYKIYVSPADRARQTAEALGLPFTLSEQVSPTATAANILAQVNWPSAKGAVVVVGHQPALGQVAALLLSGNEANWSIKKGALWWFSNRLRDDETQTVLRAVITPDML
ncbi:MAG TPA: histidine phosphatase family protein [Burkholderiales bacterium]|nr:histidine phosphatase family protein [Burkholderiales bacterium]